MATIDLKEGIKLEVLESDSASEAECGSGACGCGSAQEEPDQTVVVVAGGSADACCEPGCSPETCGSAV